MKKVVHSHQMLDVYDVNKDIIQVDIISVNDVNQNVLIVMMEKHVQNVKMDTLQLMVNVLLLVLFQRIVVNYFQEIEVVHCVMMDIIEMTQHVNRVWTIV